MSRDLPYVLPYASTCQPPSAPSGATFPTDEDLITYGACQGAAQLSGSSVYQTIATAVETGVIAGLGVEVAIASAAYGAEAGLLLIGASDFAATIAIGASVAIPVLGWAVGILAGLYAALQLLTSCNFPVWKQGGTETIECDWYPSQWIPNAISWLNGNIGTAVTMSAEEFAQQNSVFIDSSDPLLTAAALLPLDYDIRSLPTAYDMLKQIQLPAAAAVLTAAPGMLIELTKTQTIVVTEPGGAKVPVPNTTILQMQFPALKMTDVQNLLARFMPVYLTNYSLAVSYAANPANQPIDGTAFKTKFGLSLADATGILQANASSYVPPVAATKPGAGVATKAVGTLATVGGIAAVGLLAFKLYRGYSVVQTVRSAWRDTKAIGSKIESGLVRTGHKVEADAGRLVHRRGRKSNPLDRSLATGGRSVAYRAVLGGRDVILFENGGAVLYRDEARVTAFKPSSFQKTKIRAGSGEVLIFNDQLI